jgi:hypothetical protein
MNYRWRLERTSLRRKLEQLLQIGLMYDYGSDKGGSLRRGLPHRAKVHGAIC